jgi:hypothetical protein
MLGHKATHPMLIINHGQTALARLQYQIHRLGQRHLHVQRMGYRLHQILYALLMNHIDSPWVTGRLLQLLSQIVACFCLDYSQGQGLG